MSHLNTFLALLFVASGVTGLAQEQLLDAQFYGIEEGLSHRNVQCIHQDRQGFIWLGTDHGLNRFDGYHFKWFFKGKQGLLSNEVNHILEDKNGLLWLFDTGYFTDQKVNALTIFDPATYTFQSLEEKFGKTLPFAATDIIAFAGNEKGYLTFVTKNLQLATYTGDWEIVPCDLGQHNLPVRITWSPDDTFWVLQEEKYAAHTLLVVDRKGVIRERLPHPSRHIFYKPGISTDGAYVQLLHDFRNGKPFASIKRTGLDDSETQHRLSIYDPSNTLIYNDLCRTKSVDSPGHFWMVIDDHNLIAVDKKSGIVDALSDRYPMLKNTNCLFLDKDQTVWVGTIFGVFHFQIKNASFKVYLQNQGTGDLAVCRQITGDQADRIWVRVENPSAIWQLDLAGNKTTEASKKNGALPPLPLSESENKALYFTSDHTLLYPDKGDLIRADPRTHRFTRIPTQQASRIFWTLHEDKYGKTWFCDKLTNEIGFLNGAQANVLPRKLSENGFLYVYQFLESPQSDSTWLPTNQGLFLLNIKSGEVHGHFWSRGKDSSYFPFDNIHHLYADKDGSFWAATSADGIVHFTRTAEGLKVIRQYTRIDGLSNNAVYAIYGDDYDNLWLATDYGINQFSKKTGRFRNYTVKDGLSSNEFNRSSHFQDKDGTIYFGSMNGITAFCPKDFTGDTQRKGASMAISNFEQFDGRQNKLLNKLGEILQSNTIVMRPDDQFFLLEFALLNFHETDKSQFAYRVEGVDKQWNYQKENFIRLSRLPFGRHTLIIKGQDAGGEWSDKELIISVVVLKPFYLQIWFLALVLFSLLAGALFFYKWRVGNLKAQRDELERVVAERTRQISEDKKTIEQQAGELKSLEQLKSRFFANVSHELRTPLTLLLGPVNSLLKRKEKTDGEELKLLQFVQRNARHLQKLINEILDLSKLESNKMEVTEEPVQFYPYLREQMAQFHSAAQSNGLHLQLKFQAGKSLQILLDKSKVEKIIHNFCSNALKFTPKGGSIILSVEDTGEQLLLSVADTGRGIHPDDLPHVFDRFYQSRQTDVPVEGGTGIGLSLVKELAELLGGAVWVESESGKGSMFYFRFPKKEVAAAEAGKKTGNAPVPESIRKPAPARIEAPAPGTLPTRGSTILIVEDNADLREYLQFLLSGYKVLTAENGKVALEMLEAKSKEQKAPPLIPHSSALIPHSPSLIPDLIISDLMMPVMDGFQLLERLKSDDRWRHLPVIMLTAKVNVQAKLHALRIGVDDYLIKPFEEDELKARIDNLLRNYRERMEAFAQNRSATDADPGPVMAAVDSEWLREVESVFTRHLTDSRLNVDFAAGKMNLSERQFHRRLKQLTGLPPNQYLQEIRLQRAKDLLVHGRLATVKEVVSAVGFQDVRHFSDLFKKHFGANPSDMRK